MLVVIVRVDVFHLPVELIEQHCVDFFSGIIHTGYI
jgi:hypothetical protein